MSKREYDFWVYILASRSRTLYIGMTNGLTRRTTEHKSLAPGSFTARYGILRLVYFEHHQYVLNAIAREKQLKKWTRVQKIALIEESNPTWEDLFQQFSQAIVPTLDGQQISFGNDNQSAGDERVSAPVTTEWAHGTQRIPFGNDNQSARTTNGGHAQDMNRKADE